MTAKSVTIFGISIIGAIILYVLILNIASYFITQDYSDPEIVQESEDGLSPNVGVGGVVDVLVERHRWYGTVIETSTAGHQESYLILVGEKILPMNIDGNDFTIVHITFISLIIIAIMGFTVIAIWTRR